MSDQESADPPDNRAADNVFDFTTLGSAHMRQLITELRESNDYVVLHHSAPSRTLLRQLEPNLLPPLDDRALRAPLK